jgi:DNA-binding transcriptional MerR regulator
MESPPLFSEEEAASSTDALEALRRGDRRDPRFETDTDPRIPPDQRYFKIGEVAKITGIKPYVLRFWESHFPWIRPTKTSSKQRRYRREDIALLLRIGRLRYEEQLTIDKTREMIREGRKQGTAVVEAKRAPDRAEWGAVLRSLGEMRKAVLELLEAVEE